jgi:hypothetical protein
MDNRIAFNCISAMLAVYLSVTVCVLWELDCTVFTCLNCVCTYSMGMDVVGNKFIPGLSPGGVEGHLTAVRYFCINVCLLSITEL